MILPRVRLLELCWHPDGTLHGHPTEGSEAELVLADLAKCEPVLALCSPCKISLLQALGAALALTGPRVRVLQLGWHRVLKL